MSKVTRIIIILLLPVLLLPCLAPCEETTAKNRLNATEQTDQDNPEEWNYDEENAKEILEVCAGCHGQYGQGGKDGTYPRLAGLPTKYIAKQLRAFKARKRINIPMLPYATERELPEADVRDIALYFSKVKLLSKMPRQDEEMDALDRLLLAKHVFNVPKVEGDIEKGRALYKHSCQKCHGKVTRHRSRKTPSLTGQYTKYLRRQIGLFLDGKREHKKVKKIFAPLSTKDLDNLFAFLAAADD